jgi:hypothetical protein
MNYKKLFFTLLTICIIGLSTIIYMITRTDYNTSVPPYDLHRPGERLSLMQYLSGIPIEQLADKFPYNEYIQSVNITQATLIDQDLRTLDSLYPGNPNQNKRLLSVVLTDSLMSRVKNKYVEYQPDSLILLMDWTESFRHYANAQPGNAFLYDVIYRYWGSFISNQLSSYTQKNSKLKFDSKFKILEARCSFNRFTVAPKVSSIEKVIYNVLGLHWSHLFDASWNQASTLQKIFFALLFCITIVAYYCLFSVLMYKLRSQKSVS